LRPAIRTTSSAPSAETSGSDSITIGRRERKEIELDLECGFDASERRALDRGLDVVEARGVGLASSQFPGVRNLTSTDRPNV
jgi:hypothetical protein